MMPDMTTLQALLGLGAAGFAVAFLALWAIILTARPGLSPAAAAPEPEVVFIFDGEGLVDATPAAQRLLRMTEPRGSDLHRLLRFLAARFPHVCDRIQQSEETDHFVVHSGDGRSRLHVDAGDGLCKLTLSEIAPDPGADAIDNHSLDALESELAMMRETAESAPFPTWRQAEDGRILYANAAYREIEDALLGPSDDTAWPRRVFEIDPPAEIGSDRINRAQISPPNRDPVWYEYRVAQVGPDYLVVAVEIDRIVHAERSLKDFVQTLTQTFAHLNVGLAVFSAGRELAVFNPALSDLMNLPPDFLIQRPTLFQVFDRLREQQMMPEPRNYRAWCQQMSALEEQAADGTYSETWSLFDGRTLRVTGRPHHEGSVAFLFEDISAEISLKSTFRTDARVQKAILDGLEEAVGVFSPSGKLVVHNAAFDALWFGEAAPHADTSLSFIDMSRLWQEATAPTPVWGDVRDFIATIGERSAWTADVMLLDGRRLACRFDTLPAGNTLVAFTVPVEAPLVLHDERAQDPPARATA